jgi:hypothetical protein
MRKVVGVFALALYPGGALAADQISLSEREELVRQTLTAFYTHLLADHPPSECPSPV